MAIKTLAPVALAATLLAGCGNVNSGLKTQQEWAAIGATINAEFEACNVAVINQPEYASLLPHTFKGAVPARELANETLPTPEEARLVVARWDERAPCRTQRVAAISQRLNRPDAVPVLTANYAALTENVARFGQGHMTWAAYAREAQKITMEGDRQAAASNEIKRQQEAQAAEARRENAIAAAAILGATMPRPPQTLYVAPCTVNAQIAHAC